MEKCKFFFFRTRSFDSSTNFVRLASWSNLESNKQAPGADPPGAEEENITLTEEEGEGSSEEDVDTDEENNDPSYEPNPPKRPRYEEASSGGGGREDASGGDGEGEDASDGGGQGEDAGGGGGENASGGGGRGGEDASGGGGQGEDASGGVGENASGGGSGNGGGGEDASASGVRRYPAQVPENILELTAGLAVVEKMSVRQHLMFLSGVLTACGVNLDDLTISLATAHRVRVRECERIKEETLENFRTALEDDPGVHLVAHFDGKFLNHDMKGKTGANERMVTLVSGPCVVKPQPLAAIPMNQNSGYESANTVCEVLRENKIDSRIVAVVADTCSVNFGANEGAVYHLATQLDRQLLYLECKHHDEDLVPKAVKRVLSDRDTTSPTDYVVSTWQKGFVKVQEEVRGDDFVLNTFDWDWVEDHPQVKASVLAARDWARQARREKEFDKNDYSSLVNDILVYLGDVVPGYSVPRPAKVHQQFMI